MAEAAAHFVAASSSSHGHTVSDIVSLGGSEPDINRLPQVAEALNVIIKKPSNTPSSGQPAAFSMEWLPPKEDDSSNMQKVLAILQKHVCDDKSVAVNATSRAFNNASFPAHFSAKRVKLNPTKTDCLIVAKSVEEVAVQNPRSIHHQVCVLLLVRGHAHGHMCGCIIPELQVLSVYCLLALPGRVIKVRF